MSCYQYIFRTIVFGILLLSLESAWSQQHRATHLGNPSTRFANPLNSMEDLRARFRDPRLQPDMETILRLANWTGNFGDLIQAAQVAEISEIQIQPGTIMPFMSSRKNGRPITLMEVEWAGKLPTSAYAFSFTSNGRRYRCVTPKACSNFFVEDLGAPTLSIQCDAPEEVLVGRPALICLILSNTGDGPEMNPAVEIEIPQAARLTKIAKGGVVHGNKVRWEPEALAPQSEVKVCAEFMRSEPGLLPVSWTASGSLASAVNSKCETRVVGIPAILLEVVDLSDPVEIGSEVTYQIKVTNQGSAADSNIRIFATLGEHQEFVSSTGATPVSCQGQTLTMESLEILAPRAEASWNVVVRALAAEDVRFRTELLSTQLARPVEETEATRQY